MRKRQLVIDGIPVRCGPGGIRCACCFPAPGSDDRRAMVKEARRRAKREAIREGLESDKEDSE